MCSFLSRGVGDECSDDAGWGADLTPRPPCLKGRESFRASCAPSLLGKGPGRLGRSQCLQIFAAKPEGAYERMRVGV